MTRFTTLMVLLALGGSAWARPADQASDRQAALKARVERFKQLTPEQKQKLRERVEFLKKLPAYERGRLQDNLRKFQKLPAKDQQLIREKIQKLSPDDKKAFMDIAAGFFQWGSRQGLIEGFPREAFFHWVKEQRADELTTLRGLEPADRKNGFFRLYNDFKAESLKRLREHVEGPNGRRGHKCSTEEQLRLLADADAREFWPELRRTWERCPGRHSNGGPVPPRK